MSHPPPLATTAKIYLEVNEHMSISYLRALRESKHFALEPSNIRRGAAQLIQRSENQNDHCPQCPKIN